MKSYLEILQNILDYGTEKYPTRNIGNVGQVDGSVRTIGLPNVNWFHNMDDGFPLLTTKKMAFKTFCVELEGFIKGITDKGWYQERKCHIWDGWANPKKVQQTIDELNEGTDGDVSWGKLQIQKDERDLGKLYGAQWRDFNSEGYDQLKYIVDTLKTNPYDRRMVCSAWNPNQFDEMALVPCHYSWGVTVYGNKLHMNYSIRSNDYLLGAPGNFMSYSLLLLLLCKESNFTPGTVCSNIIDCHIYENQLEAAHEQLTRNTYSLPQVQIPDKLKSGKPFSIYDWTYEDVKLLNYKCHPAIKCEVVV